MRQRKKKPLARKPAARPEPELRNARKRRNAWEPQVIVPHQVDLPLSHPDHEEVAVPVAPNGRSLASGRF